MEIIQQNFHEQQIEVELNNKYNKQELHELHMSYALSCMHGVQKKFLKDAEIREKKTLN